MLRSAACSHEPDRQSYHDRVQVFGREGNLMTTETNKAVVRRFFEDAWNRNQVSDLEEYIAADRIHHYGARVAREGVDVLRKVIRNWRGAMPD